MYRFIRTVSPNFAVSMPAALKFCAEVTAHVNKTYGLHMKAGVGLFGAMRIYWFNDMESLDEMVQLNGKLMQDRAYWEILDKAKHLWVEGSMEDKVVSLVA